MADRPGAPGGEGAGSSTTLGSALEIPRYRLVRLLGHGAFGESEQQGTLPLCVTSATLTLTLWIAGIVVQAEDLENGAMVAIKLLSRGSNFSSSAAVSSAALCESA
jgi:hypothetical protein